MSLAIKMIQPNIHHKNNECKRRKQSITSSSEDSDGEGEYAYRKLSRLEKIQNHELYSFIGKTFHDVDDDDGSALDGVVVDVVIENVESTICFEYSLSNKPAGEFGDEQNDHDYIVAEYAIQQCQWIDDKHQCQKKINNNHPTITTKQMAWIRNIRVVRCYSDTTF